MASRVSRLTRYATRFLSRTPEGRSTVLSDRAIVLRSIVSPIPASPKITIWLPRFLLDGFCPNNSASMLVIACFGADACFLLARVCLLALRFNHLVDTIVRSRVTEQLCAFAHYSVNSGRRVAQPVFFPFTAAYSTCCLEQTLWSQVSGRPIGRHHLLRRNRMFMMPFSALKHRQEGRVYFRHHRHHCHR